MDGGRKYMNAPGSSSKFAGLTRQVAAVFLLALPLLVTAAPPPPPEAESSLGKIQLRQAIQQSRRFAAAGLAIPNAPANGGQCVIEITGQFAQSPLQGGASGNYRLHEIQRWVVSETPIAAGQNPLRYAVQWSTTGNGERHEDNGVGTRNDWAFAISGANSTQITATKIASTGNWLLQAAPASFANGVTVTQQQTIVGRPPLLPMKSQSAASAVAFPGMTALAAPSGSQTRVAEVRTFQVPREINWGYPRPGYATGSIACTWTVAVGP
jgi:hypothetical protein